MATNDAPTSDAFAPIVISGPAWVEYHLLLGDTAHGVTRIEREVRTVAGAPLAAVLLARWRREVEGENCGHVELRLTLGHDPNARLLRRELEKFAQVLPLRVLLEEEGAPEVPYRILMWPREASTSGGEASQVLQCGDVDEPYVVTDEHGERKYLRLSPAACAARAWARRSGTAAHVASAKARKAWQELDLRAKLALDLSWRAVEEAVQEAAGAGEQIT